MFTLELATKPKTSMVLPEFILQTKAPGILILLPLFNCNLSVPVMSFP